LGPARAPPLVAFSSFFSSICILCRPLREWRSRAVPAHLLGILSPSPTIPSCKSVIRLAGCSHRFLAGGCFASVRAWTLPFSFRSWRPFLPIPSLFFQKSLWAFKAPGAVPPASSRRFFLPRRIALKIPEFPFFKVSFDLPVTAHCNTFREFVEYRPRKLTALFLIFQSCVPLYKSDPLFHARSLINAFFLALEKLFPRVLIDLGSVATVPWTPFHWTVGMHVCLAGETSRT